METLFDDEIAQEVLEQNKQYKDWVEKHCRPSHPITSVEAAEKMAPKVGKAMDAALDALRITVWDSGGPATAKEIERYNDASDGEMRKRLSDLRAKGLAKVTGSRPCRITGRNAQTWEAT